ncbi:polysaccharide deacetylase family protein [Streptomyces sp. NPDC101227]|uniref:polysaccharide deacetylase family protein n=1 Tax=Streptomyces sp. NPDC101227 TaxID=3366136 RepID=UPI0038157C1A
MQIVRLFRSVRVRDEGTGAVAGAAARARGLAALSVLGLLAAGCGVVRGEDLLDNEPGAGPTVVAPDPRALLSQARMLERAQARQVAAAKRYGLAGAPLSPPRPPAFKPFLTTEPRLARGKGTGLPAVIARVPTRAKVVFLTVDDADAKDPDFVRMMRELDVPYSAFPMAHQRVLPPLPAAAQRDAICDQQDLRKRASGRWPALFRPPLGAYTLETLRMAAACGVRVVPLWNEEASPGRIAYRERGHRLQPGDIVLARTDPHRGRHGALPEAAREVLRTARAQGFAIGALEDYV